MTDSDARAVRQLIDHYGFTGVILEVWQVVKDYAQQTQNPYYRDLKHALSRAVLFSSEKNLAAARRHLRARSRT